MNTRHETIWDNVSISEASSPLSQTVTGNAVCGIRIQNRSIYPLLVTEKSTGAPVEEIPSMSYCVLPNPVDFILTLLVASNNLTPPASQKVTLTYINTPVTYQFGALTQLQGQSQPTSEVTNTLSTDVGVGFVRLKGGGTFYAGSGITAVNFTNPLTGKAQPAQQVVLFNSGQSNVSFWGDEDGNTGTVPSDAPVLVPGGSFSLAWATQAIYLASTGTQIPVQVQGWG